jgi:Zn-dependent protease with chaperone function
MDTAEPDVAVDLPSIAAVKRQLFRRWISHYASLVVKIVPIASLCGFGLHWLIRWLNPGPAYVSPLILPLAFGIAALLICLWTLPAMLWLDVGIDKRLTEMARRVAAGEAVYASEVETWRGGGKMSAKESSPNKSLERTREG